MSKELTWQDVYQLPLHGDVSSYLWSANNDVMALQFRPSFPKGERGNVLELINGTGGVKLKGVTNDGIMFYHDGKEMFYIRGWGYLTGSGAFNLSHDVAIEIQGGFIDHVLKSISE